MSHLYSSTLTTTLLATSYGHLSSAGLPEAMDVDTNDDSLIHPPLISFGPPATKPSNLPTPSARDSTVSQQPIATPDLLGGCDGAAPPVSTSKARPPQRSNLSQNLLHVFNLDSLAATVARTDPMTGEKINKMRKSYDGQLKVLQLAGKNKSVKHEDARFGIGLSQIYDFPDEEWQTQKVHGKGVPEFAQMKLEAAMQMQPGSVPQNNEWEDLLGIEKIKQSDLNTKAAKSFQFSKSETASNGIEPNAARAQDADAIRPKRAAKKRRYDEGSFEGYGEGYVDDDIDGGGGGYTSGETHGSRTSATKRRRKTKDYGSNPSGFGDRTGNYGAAPLEISAYGR